MGKRAGLDSVHPHMLRAAFIMAALDAGVPLRDVQTAARPADPRTTTTTTTTDAARTSTATPPTSSPTLPAVDRCLSRLAASHSTLVTRRWVESAVRHGALAA
ncbi:MAG: hypothetical protein ACRDZ4_18000 [Egibacteraceae bacterium]